MRRPKSTQAPSRPRQVLKKPIVLVGLMGAGKSSIGRLLAARLDLDFVDADAEIESAAHATIEEIFNIHGEAAFRSGERRVIARLLAGPVRVVATGGGAFMDDQTRKQIKALAHSVWLKADLKTLLKRVSRRGGRPLLTSGNPHTVMTNLMAERDPVYAAADITVETSENPPAEVADQVIKELEKHLGVGPLAPARRSGKNRNQTQGDNGNSTANGGVRPTGLFRLRRTKRAGTRRRNNRQAKSRPGNRG